MRAMLIVLYQDRWPALVSLMRFCKLIDPTH
jgi:hypothetical protein